MSAVGPSPRPLDRQAGTDIDPGLPSLDRALDPMAAEFAIRESLSDSETSGLGRLEEIRLLHHRPGRRCVLSYSFAGSNIEAESERRRFVGKIRSKGVNRRSNEVALALRARGFSETGDFGFSVCEPLSVVTELDMTLQRFYPGPCVTEFVSKGTANLERFAEIAVALAELHADGVPTDRRHTVGNERAILEERLPRVADKIPILAQRIQRLMESARPVAEALVSRPVRPIHRDFYPDQIIAASGHLVLLDLDLYTMGDPALDVGNFVAHLREQGLRELGDDHAFRDAESAFVKSYLAASSETLLDEVDKWTHLSFLRHLEISWRIEERRRTLGLLVASCEHSARALGVL
jgi:hypothetical protein